MTSWPAPHSQIDAQGASAPQSPSDKGARLDVKNKAGRTPLEAVLRGRETSDDTVALLKKLSSASAPGGARDAAATTN